MEICQEIFGFFKINAERAVNCAPSFVKRNFFKANYDVIVNHLKDINWDLTLSNDNLDNNITSFNEVINNLIGNNVPTSYVDPNSYPKWYDHDLIRAIRDKKRTHSMWKAMRDPSLFIEFKRLRAICIRMSRIKYRDYIKSVESSLRINIKSFWSFVKSLKSDSNIPSEMLLNDRTASNDLETVNLFSLHFSSVLTEADRSSLVVNFSVEEILSDINITAELVTSIVLNLKDNVNSGPDNIPAYFIKKCWTALVKPILIIFKKIVNTGYFPTEWKTSYISPIFKSGNKHNIYDYRPISQLSCIPKIMDALLANNLMDKLFCKIAEQQHGFTHGRSTLTNLLIFNNYLSENPMGGTQIDAIYTDFSKAFDKVSHRRLLSKLWDIGVRGNVFAVISSYLTDRYQSVRINNSISSPVLVTSGVPQGSHLGPILFTIFINDLVRRIKFSNLLLYADDAKLFHSINSSDDVRNLQIDLDALTDWCTENELFLNIEKCKVISFYKGTKHVLHDYLIDNRLLCQVDIVKDLGILFDSNVTFAPHIDSIVSKTIKSLGFLKRTTCDFTDVSAIIHLYKSIVLPNLLYCCQIWSPFILDKINLLEAIQHKFSTFIAYKLNQPMHRLDHDYTPLASECSLPTIASLHRMQDHMFVYKTLHDYICSDFIKELFGQRQLIYNLRCHRILLEDTTRSNYGFYSSVNRMRRLYNLLPMEIRNVSSIGLFKFRVKSLVSIY